MLLFDAETAGGLVSAHPVLPRLPFCHTCLGRKNLSLCFPDSATQLHMLLPAILSWAG